VDVLQILDVHQAELCVLFSLVERCSSTSVLGRNELCHGQWCWFSLSSSESFPEDFDVYVCLGLAALAPGRGQGIFTLFTLKWWTFLESVESNVQIVPLGISPSDDSNSHY